MSAKFKSTKKKPELEAEVDDWDVSDEEGTLPQSTQQYQRKVYQDAWGDDGETNSIERPKVEGRTLWEEANRQTPQPQPIVQNRSIPVSLLAPGLSSTSSAPTSGRMDGTSVNSITNDEYDSRPPPQILRRDRSSQQAAEQAAAIAAANAAKQKKSLAEREKEYKLARERIFGGIGGSGKVDASTTTSTAKSTPSQSRNGSGSDTGGRNSPNINVKGKKIR